MPAPHPDTAIAVYARGAEDQPPSVYLLGAGSALRPRVLSVRVLRVRARLAGRGLLDTPLNMLAVGFTSSLLCTQPPRPSKPPAAAHQMKSQQQKAAAQ